MLANDSVSGINYVINDNMNIGYRLAELAVSIILKNGG